jgi:protein-disulfide isomerase
MPPFRRAALALSTLALAPACTGERSGEAPGSVARMPASEVESIVRSYLLENPEILAEAFSELNRREQAKLFQDIISNPDDPSIGPENAKVVVVEYFDYNCGYCKAANEWLFRQVDDKRGDVRVIFKEMPILAETSLIAARGALAADRQGRYRDMHLALMKARDLSQAGVEATAQSLGLDMKRFRSDMASDDVLAHIETVARESERAQVRGTPGFFINGEFLNGFDEARLSALIEQARKQG